jgi:hypothetical protein
VDLRPLVIGEMVIVAAAWAAPAVAQDACKGALDLAAGANDLYAQVGRDLSPNACVGLKDRIAKFDAAADALKETLRAAKELCRPVPTPEFDETNRASSMREATNLLEECRQAGKGD